MIDASKSNEEIIEEVLNALKEFMPEFDITRIVSKKANDIEGDGIVFIPKGDNKGPTIYTDEWIRQYQQGRSIEDIADDTCIIVTNAIANVQRYNMDFDRDYILEHAFVTVYSRDLNTRYQVDAVNEMIPDTDLMAVVRVRVGDDATFVLSKSMASLLGLTQEEAMEAAYKNTLKEEAVVQTMGTVLSNLMGIPQEALAESEVDDCMLVITNQHKMFGAAQMMVNPEVQKQVYERLGEYYILPSSVHECIAVPVNFMDYQEGELVRIVTEINANEVDLKDVLSNNAYRFNGQKLTMADVPELVMSAEGQKMTMHM